MEAFLALIQMLSAVGSAIGLAVLMFSLGDLLDRSASGAIVTQIVIVVRWERSLIESVDPDSHPVFFLGFEVIKSFQ